MCLIWYFSESTRVSARARVLAFAYRGRCHHVAIKSFATYTYNNCCFFKHKIFTEIIYT